MLSATSITSPSSMPSPLQSRQTTAATQGLDSDGDRDNDTRESAAAQAAEQRSAAPSLPTDPNRGRTLNITA
ncbi:hypothetical protein TSH100_25600 [Azospirillum sp. TSH100]|uniref:hypothetical protein n=1 Tax=Azospirillum sp. TSH100 TaxID=652764 RepID=UPI000D61FB49|nr:hypothetical protein [Azospirillum sp. TSH100]PWC81861.1 hypothetical protein TSH100_25600 [Azospirillum sp. TSH100]QCG87381.1 hypothetical protein E6C72_06385 [Azospirillum sp. TSH100]